MAHPLDQITAEEINKAADLCKSREGFDENTIFINISLVEPEKAFIRTYNSGEEFPRQLKIRGVDSNSDGGFVAILDMNTNEVSSFERVPQEAQVPYSFPEIYHGTRVNQSQ